MLASLRVDPRATNATLPSTTPAFTSEVWIEPSRRVVDTIARPFSAVTSRRTRSRSAMRTAYRTAGSRGTQARSTSLGAPRFVGTSRHRAVPRVALVLGAGGVTGGAFHAGVLSALVDATSWDPRDAELIVGTSAGSATGGALRAGLSARDMAARARGEALS